MKHKEKTRHKEKSQSRREEMHMSVAEHFRVLQPTRSPSKKLPTANDMDSLVYDSPRVPRVVQKRLVTCPGDQCRQPHSVRVTFDRVVRSSRFLARIREIMGYDFCRCSVRIKPKPQQTNQCCALCTCMTTMLLRLGKTAQHMQGLEMPPSMCLQARVSVE